MVAGMVGKGEPGEKSYTGGGLLLTDGNPSLIIVFVQAHLSECQGRRRLSFIQSHAERWGLPPFSHFFSNPR
jgi:hypothetical protein